MKLLAVTTLALFSVPAFSQVEISKDVLEAVKMMEVAEGNIPGVLNIDYNLKASDPNCEEIAGPNENKKPMLLVKKKDELGPWKVAIKTTLVGPKGKLNKNIMTADSSGKVKSTLDKLIQTDYSSYDDRMKAVKNACQGMDDFQKISMSSMLARRLSDIYDYSRANGGSDAVIKPEQQWEALKAGQSSGVCRDASITVSQFLLACGFKKEQVAIKSYRTQNGGHQVTSIKTKDGEYTINWGEIYNQDTKDFKAPEPSIPNTGLFYTLYDPETGKILEQRRTELGDAMKILAGGKPNDPLYTPDMIVAEAAYGGFAAKVFQNADSMGNATKGAAASYNSLVGNEREFMELSGGIVYGKNERDILYNNTTVRNLKQDIIYVQMESKQQKAFPLFDGKSGKLSVAPKWGASMDGSVSFNDYNNKKSKSIEMYTEFSGGSTLYYDSDPVKARIGGEVVMNFTQKMYNSENDKSQKGIYVTRYILDTGASWENDRVVASVDSNLIISKTEKQLNTGIGVKDKKTDLSCQAIYSVYNKNFGSRDDYVVSRCSKDVTIEKVGRVSFDANTRYGLSEDAKDVRLMLGASLKFK